MFFKGTGKAIQQQCKGSTDKTGDGCTGCTEQIFPPKKNRLKAVLASEEGMGVVEVILIIVVLIGLVIIFQTNIKGVVASIFSTIQKNAGSIR